MTFEPGDKVIVAGDPRLGDGISGALALPEPFMLELTEPNGGRGHRRFVQGSERMMVFCYVVFDRPQDDGSGDGPYRGAEIDETHICRA